MRCLPVWLAGILLVWQVVSAMERSSPRPILIYDADCRFCGLWIAWCRAHTGDRVDYVPSTRAGKMFPEIPPEDFEKSVQFIPPDGARRQFADAVFMALATAWMPAKVLVWAQGSVPGFRPALNFLYRIVARNRAIFSVLTRLLWGSDVRPTTYAVSSGIFLRLLGMIYLIAFGSFAFQAPGLLGSGGILPLEKFFPAAHAAIGAEAYRLLPSLVWFCPSDAMLGILSVLGCILSLLLVAGFAQGACALLLWIVYLSLTQAGQVFYSFQWDILLIEAGFLAIFLAPWTLRSRWRAGSPHPVAHFLFLWLLFRLMFASGIVKLTSGDAAWWDLTALHYHWFTQPLPNPVAWYFEQLPAAFQRISCGAMFLIEIVLPFFIFFPRVPRLLAFAGFIGLQLMITVSGNYGFFNLLSAALALLLVDDLVWGRKWGRFFSDGGRTKRGNGWLAWAAAVIIVPLSVVPLWSAFRRQPPSALLPLVGMYEYAAPFHIVNGYGLFAVMTKERPEITIEGSLDGVTWKPYLFYFKPGPLSRMPPIIPLYMPRLDWQMWFAALGGVEENPWFVELLHGLLEARPAVLALLEVDPFGGIPPRYVRAEVADYRFGDGALLAGTGNWWKSTPGRPYVRAVTLEDFPSNP